MSIKKTMGTITHVTELSKSAREVTISLKDELEFSAGSFVNIFMNINDEKVRRAYSISSSDSNSKSISLSIRLSPGGKMTPYFWNEDIIGKEIEIMGPLGLNTANKMDHSKLFLFGFGIGAGVVKSIAEHFVQKNSFKELTIITGSRTEDEIIYKNYFDTLVQNSDNITVDYIVSSPSKEGKFKKGYIQDYLEDFDFSNSNVYVCGQEVACTALVKKVNESNPENCAFFIEGFH